MTNQEGQMSEAVVLDPFGNPIPEGRRVVICDECQGAGTVPTSEWSGHMWCPKCPHGDGWWFEAVKPEGTPS